MNAKFDGSMYLKHTFNGLINDFELSANASTSGLIGASKEKPAREKINLLLPNSVSVGSGVVIDSYGNKSKQQDIIIYENLCPVFSHAGTEESNYYPVEGVVAVGEVKSTLGKSEIEQAINNGASAKACKRRANFSEEGLVGPSVPWRRFSTNVLIQGTPEQSFDQINNPMDQIFSFVLCEKLKNSSATTIKNFAQKVATVGSEKSPNMLLSITDGAILPFSQQNNTLPFSLGEADGYAFCTDAVNSFSLLIERLRWYCSNARTVDIKVFERYFTSIGTEERQLPLEYFEPVSTS